MQPQPRARPDRTRRIIVFVTFESEAAPVGGLGAVMSLLPRRVARVEPECFTIAPFFRTITAHRKPELFKAIRTTGHRFEVRFQNRPQPVEIFEYVDQHGFKTCFLDSPDFFNAPDNPFLNPAAPDQLLADALFFCSAVPQALVELGKTEDIVVCLQDWETACVALTISENPAIRFAAAVLVLHNAYDKPLPEPILSAMGWRKARGSTVLRRTIPSLTGPLCTVSENFARELTHEPLLARVYTPHLQALFKKKGIVGINNGLFEPLDFPGGAIEAARAGDFLPILEEKQTRRTALVREMQQDWAEQPWGQLDWTDFNGPIFMMFGRDDPRQKGYDLAAAAIREIPEGLAKFIFTPIPGDEGLAGLGFLKRLAEERAGEVLVFPFRMSRGYKALQQGSSYLVLSSFYEPFGGATEGYSVGTPVLARATGGLVQQVVPHPSVSLPGAVSRLVSTFHPKKSLPSGLLFREPDMPLSEVVAGWRTINECAYWPDGDRIADRVGTPLYDGMVQAATRAFLDAIKVYTDDPVDYARMIFGGFELLKRFSWDASVAGYRRVFDQVCD